MNDLASSEPVAYMERTRLYYQALGYEHDYVWAHYDEVPIAHLSKPLANATIALVTTALPPELAEARTAGKRQLWSRETDNPPAEFVTNHVAWDKDSTHTRDRECFMPIDAIKMLAAEGTVGGLAPRFHGVPTTYSQNRTTEQDAPEITRRIVQDGADAVVLCPL
jgi:hypothetical protein